MAKTVLLPDFWDFGINLFIVFRFGFRLRIGLGSRFGLSTIDGSAFVRKPINDNDLTTNDT
jgi:hypothetical protein